MNYGIKNNNVTQASALSVIAVSIFSIMKKYIWLYMLQWRQTMLIQLYMILDSTK